MIINEVFYDLEGEGKHAGKPTLFIRLTGCNLRCSWCDTKHAYHGGREMTPKAVAALIKKSPYQNVNITGGEPLQQAEEIRQVLRLVKNKIVSIETNGSLPVEGIKADTISMDIKLPASGEQKRNLLSNLKILRASDQVKLVAGSLKDLQYAREVLAKHMTKAEIFAQPVFGKIKPKVIRDFILKNKLLWRLGLQQHKVVEGK